MAATDPRNRGSHGSRRFITRLHVEDAATTGQPIKVTGRDVVTDEAAQRAEDLGVRIEREKPGAPSARSAGPSPAAPAAPADVRKAVHSAVVAELGMEPAGLAAAIDRVMERRGR